MPRSKTPQTRSVDMTWGAEPQHDALQRVLLASHHERQGLCQEAATKSRLDYLDCALLLQGLPPPRRIFGAQLVTSLEEYRPAIRLLKHQQQDGTTRRQLKPIDLLRWARAHDCAHQLPQAFIDAVPPAESTGNDDSWRCHPAFSDARLRASDCNRRVAAAWWAPARAGLKPVVRGRQVKSALNLSLSPTSIARIARRQDALDDQYANWQRHTGRGSPTPKGRGRPSEAQRDGQICRLARELRLTTSAAGTIMERVARLLADPRCPQVTKERARKILYEHRVFKRCRRITV